MPDEHLTADECDELAEALSRDAAALPIDEREALLDVAAAYRALAKVKRMVARNMKMM